MPIIWKRRPSRLQLQKVDDRRAPGCSAGIRDIIDKPGKNGLLISPYDCNKYAKELLRIALDTQQLALMSAMSLIKAKDYDMEKNSSGYQQLLEELI